MMSLNEYIIASCLATGAFTLHDLLATLLHVENVPPDSVDEVLHDGLHELSKRGWIIWTYEPAYGDRPSQKPNSFDSTHFEHDWKRCIAHGRLREGIPDSDNPTMLVEATDSLIRELDKPEYTDKYSSRAE